MGISRQCASKWVNRFRRYGELGLADRSATPHRSPTATPARSWPGSKRCAVNGKKVGRIRDGDGWRVHGRDSLQHKANYATRSRGERVGYVFLHSALDGYSRLAYTEALPTKKL